MSKRKILFVLPSLTAGGAERVISFVAQNINKDKFESTLLIAGFKKDAAYDTDNLNIKFLEKSRVLNATLGIFVFILKYQPDVVMSSIGNLNTVIGLISIVFPKTKFVIREASVISYFGKHNINPRKNYTKIYSILSHYSYRKIDVIVCQSKDMADDFINIYDVSRNKIIIINNPITKFFPVKILNTNKQNKKKFITVGRLSREKGHIRIIKMLSMLDISFHYTIIGDGPYKKDIFKAIREYNLSDKITYIPFSTQILEHIASNDYFLQGSYVEGFPNTVLESCLVGTTVIAFNVPGGTKEIITHKKNGYLVDNENEYIDCLKSSKMLDPININKSVKSKFSSKKIIKQYEALFE